MDKRKLTPWYTIGVLPLRDGVYETKRWSAISRVRSRGFSYYTTRDGWGPQVQTKKLAAAHRNTRWADQNKEWRGLMGEP